MQAWQACQAGRPLTPNISPSFQPACALRGCFLAMIIMTMGPEVLCQDDNVSRIHPKAYP